MNRIGGWVGLLLQCGLVWGQSGVQLPTRWTIKQWAGSDTWTWTMTQRGPGVWNGVARHDQTGQQGSWDFTQTKVEGNRITLYRSGVGAYNGVVTNDGRSLNGTCDFIGGGWSATFTSPVLGANAVSEKAKSLLPAGFTMKQWNGAESWTWTMTQRSADNWSATVRQDQSGQQGSGYFTVTKMEGNRITIFRDGAGSYMGVVSADGRAITGTCDFIGGGWSIALTGVPPPPPPPPKAAGVRYRVELLVFNNPDIYQNPRNYHGYMVDFSPPCTVRGLNQVADRGQEVIRVLVCRDKQRLTFTQSAPGMMTVEHDWVFLDGGKTIAGAYRQGPGFGPAIGGIY